MISIEEAIRTLESEHCGLSIDPNQSEAAFHTALACMYCVLSIKNCIDTHCGDSDIALEKIRTNVSMLNSDRSATMVVHN